MHQPEIDVARLVVLVLDVALKQGQQVYVAACVGLARNILRFDDNKNTVVLVQNRDVIHCKISAHCNSVLE